VLDCINEDVACALTAAGIERGDTVVVVVPVSLQLDTSLLGIF
jgi:non-ribosomal peptide synthetase component E (peptide arylation enzyme)